MNEVKRALQQFADSPTDARPGDPSIEQPQLPDFAEVAADWAKYCVHNLRGDLLKLGLDVTAALAEFDRGLKYPETLKQ